VIHLFDLDHTLLYRSSSYYFLMEGFQRRAFSFRQFRGLPLEWLKYKLHRVNPSFVEQAIKALAGTEKSLLEDIAARSFEGRLRPNLYAEGLGTIRRLQDAGEEVHLATTSFSTVIKPLEEFLGLRDSICSVLEFQDGRATGRLVGIAPFGDNKKAAVASWLEERHLDRGNVCMYSDSYSDLGVMDYCGSAQAVNPDRYLLREARRRGWPTHQWARQRAS
jgi:HAD superfamily hydrolase (TIGR01490 family)